nr:hypothetical protein [Salsipaludibacter albus]
MWSGPRNVSTALMYAFRSRSDTTVVDEPLLGHYLRVTGVDQPARDEVLATFDLDGDRVVREQLLGPCPTPVLFAKNMAHHLVDLDDDFLDEVRNVVLTRDPRHMLPSLVQGIPDPQLFETGLPGQVALVRRELAAGRTPVVVETATLLADPPGVLAEVCRRCDIPWDPAMLSWEAGPKPEDGPWGDFWYGSVRASTGFGPPRTSTRPVPDHLEDLLAACVDLHDEVTAHAIDPAGA